MGAEAGDGDDYARADEESDQDDDGKTQIQKLELESTKAESRNQPGCDQSCPEERFEDSR